RMEWSRPADSSFYIIATSFLKQLFLSVMWSDEAKMENFSRNAIPCAWRRKKAAGGRNMVLWVWFSAKGRGRLVCVEKKDDWMPFIVRFTHCPGNEGGATFFFNQSSGVF
uniref:Uncharacterized protein n=1 Tax=Oryzias latipes TaxID=8090 RepID=A0A3P9JFH3_ORYLA